MNPVTSPTHSLAALAAIVDIAADAIIALDDHFKIVRFNRGAEQTFGWSEASSCLGAHLQRILADVHGRGVYLQR